jgi:methyl-accepting chemotaxis protein
MQRQPGLLVEKREAMPGITLRMTGRLLVGFAALVAILAAAVGYTVFMVNGIGVTVDRMVTLRTPVAISSTQLVGNLYSTLATLRGYLLTGNPQGKADRAGMWKEMDATAAEFDKMAERFTNPENKRKWSEAKSLTNEFRAAQDKAETIAFTADAYPATKLLVTEAAPRVETMFSEITKMINEEETLEASPERKRLLKTMADVRGNLASAAAQLRMYLLSGEKADRERFQKPWDTFNKAFDALAGQRTLLSASQKVSYEIFAKARGELAPLPERMMTVRESPQWNMPVHILVTEAAPRALKILDLLDGPKQADGTRSGGIKTSQQLMLAEESREVRSSISFLEMIEWTLLFVGLLAAAVIVYLTARSTVRPIRALTGGMRELADGNFDVVLPGLGRKDEVGDIAQAVETFKVKAAERARLEADEMLRRQKAEAETQARAAEERAKAAEVQAQVVESLAGGLRSLSDGDLTFRLSDFPEEYRQIRDDFNTAMSRLQETIQAIAAAAREVASASAEISSGTTDLSQRTEEQAASLEQTSASMEEISATVKKNADNAQQANAFAGGTREVADRGGAVVAQAVSAMARIEESSGKISDIISVIDEIARQTNLLALNAAVEAARAGEAGRGFAVVASEVRSLAQRSSQAAKDIKDLITNSSGQVQEGVDLVNKAGSALTEILESIKKVAGIVSDIASASAEQATGIDQINTALTQMDEVTQQNSALVEQNAAAAKALEGQSEAMDRQVSFFRLEGTVPAGKAVSPAMASRQPPAAAPPRRTPAPAPAKRGVVARVQTALATAFKREPLEEF